MSAPLLSARVLTLFPEMFPGSLGTGLTGKALTSGLWSLETIQIRDYAHDRHKTVDDTPYGGGAGMVMRPDIVAAATRDTEAKFSPAKRRIYLSPRGRTLDQKLVEELVSDASLLFLCGRYEGVDQRVLDSEGFEEISLGDFILAGGESAVMVLLEACVRLLPGALGNAETHTEESFAHGLLEYPHYTRPAEWEGHAVPDVLISGHHGMVEAWRRAQAEKLTKERRPDLWQAYELQKRAKKSHGKD